MLQSGIPLALLCFFPARVSRAPQNRSESWISPLPSAPMKHGVLQDLVRPHTKQRTPGCSRGLTRRNGSLISPRVPHTLITEQRAVTFAMLDEHSPLGVWRLQTGYALAGSAKAVSYARHASEILLGTLADAVSEAESRMSRQYLGMTAPLKHVADDTASAIVSTQSTTARRVAEGAARIVDASGNMLPHHGSA